MKTTIRLGNAPLAPCSPSYGGYFTQAISRLTEENVRLEADYQACNDERRCKAIAREQNYNENRISFLRESLSEMYQLRRLF